MGGPVAADPGGDAGRTPKASVAVRDDHVAVVTLDDPARPLNVLGPELGDDLATALRALRDDSSVLGIVVRSGKPGSFVAGADIGHLRAVRVAAEARDLALELARRLAELTTGHPVVVAVHGAALGGGFELALAARAVVATRDPRTCFGLPEVKLGLLPFSNGLQRLADRAGLERALDLGLSGRTVSAEEALRLGLIDEVCSEEALLATAVARALTLARDKRGPRRRLPRATPGEALRTLLLERNAIGTRVLFAKARADLHAKTRGLYPAPERIVDVLERHSRKGFEASGALEAQAFGELVVGDVAKQLMTLFFATTALKKETGLDPRARPSAPAPAEAPAEVAVVGAGVMGAGIGYVSALAGLHVTLSDLDSAALSGARRHIRSLLDTWAARGRIALAEPARILARVEGGVGYEGLGRCGLVVEAVFEDLELKRRVVREIEAASPGCVIGSCTSSVPITRIAEGAARPERVVGMHYAHPVHRMPLLEVVRGERTGDPAIAAAVALGKRQGKTVIVVQDGTGFFTTRTLTPYLNEAAYLLAEGVAIDAIDAALVAWGFPVGPLRLLDEIGLDVCARVATRTAAAYGDRMRAPAGLERLVARGRLGRKSGLGFYSYTGRTPGKYVDPTIYEVIGVEPSKRLAAEEVQMRCALPLVNEAVRCLEEGVLRSARDGDVGAVLGLGFPALRGGPFRYVDTLGAVELLRRLRGYEARFGERFKPATLLREHAEERRLFHAD
ncbi:MAG: enoyl-CoA hydratase/isomerase family protein [Myxococcales bacterium]|nr:enoyl-CoA hydratase/isomerase family protein [Myxococcales bacterium]MBL0195758.1 enoyl-CoA hydratase/isomerase family protein [Myxococcales bacterium]